MTGPEAEEARRRAALFMDDPKWADFLPVRSSSPVKCRNPTHEDCSPIDPDAVAANLKPGGALGAMSGYEVRPGQQDMARAVARAFNSRSHLMIEAGTGVGKSLAYLLPAVEWAAVNDAPVVVSTATRNLQSQLITSDIPRAVETVAGRCRGGGLRVALLKGRGNYLCLRELGESMQGGFFALTPEEQDAFTRLVEWLHRTQDGDLDTLGADLLRERVSCPGEDCLGRRCQYFSRCFVQGARERAARAHIVVANHALVLSDAASPAADILPPYGRLVFDEAHNLEAVATRFFAIEFSKEGFAQLLGRLERRSRRRRAGADRSRGLLGKVERQLAKGELARAGNADEVSETVRKIRLAASESLVAESALLDIAGRLFAPAPREDVIRYRCVARPGAKEPLRPADLRRQYSRRGLFADYSPAEWNESELEPALVAFEARLALVAERLDGLAAALEGPDRDGEFDFFSDLRAQAVQLAVEFREFLGGVRFVFRATDPGHVFWAERTRSRRGAPEGPVRLVAAPLSVAEEMNRCFYAQKDSVVLCSATLRVGDRFDYMMRRLGFSLAPPDRVQALTAASPFDYFRQAELLGCDFMPDPGAPEYAQRLAELLVRTFAASGGRGLALFTAYDMMRATAAAAAGAFSAAGMRLLVQGDGLSREEMVSELKRAGSDGPVVLFGAQSFWEGVDVRGAALSCVVIARLPFPQVGEPIVEARAELVAVEGGSSFRDYFVPEAVIRFRQGFGRLVRSKADRGVVVVADPRMVTKNYGAIFSRAVPGSRHTLTTLDELVERVSGFLGPQISDTRGGANVV